MKVKKNYGGNMKKRIITIIVAILIIAAAIFAGSKYLFSTNKAGFYQIKQAFVTGKMSVRSEPGMYSRLFGDITTYPVSDMYYFSKSALDGGIGEEFDPILVRFNDGGTAEISGSIRYDLPKIPESQLALHSVYRTAQTVKDDLIRQIVMESLKQSAAIIKAEESYSTRRSEFTTLAEEQIRSGLFSTISEEIKTEDADGNEFIERTVKVKHDENGDPVIRKVSPFVTYNINIITFVIKDIDFDDTIDALIAKKKEAEQQKVVAEANAERAKQDAITAEEQGKARVALARADEEVEKIKAVTSAEKDKAVAELNLEKMKAEAEAILVKQSAEAEGAKLLVEAGLTPLERATIDKETAIGVAAEMAKIKFPGMMILGGSDSSVMNPFDAVGLESFLRISREISDTDSTE